MLRNFIRKFVPGKRDGKKVVKSRATENWSMEELNVAAYIAQKKMNSNTRNRFISAFAKNTGRSFDAIRKKIYRMTLDEGKMTLSEQKAWLRVYVKDGFWLKQNTRSINGGKWIETFIQEVEWIIT